MKDINKTIARREKFLKQLNLSPSASTHYKNAYKSIFLKEKLLEHCNCENIFEITDLQVLWNLYKNINLHPTNVKNHRLYSAAVNKYIRFLNNGQKYGRRIDYMKHRKEKSPL